MKNDDTGANAESHEDIYDEPLTQVNYIIVLLRGEEICCIT